MEKLLKTVIGMPRKVGAAGLGRLPESGRGAGVPRRPRGSRGSGSRPGKRKRRARFTVACGGGVWRAGTARALVVPTVPVPPVPGPCPEPDRCAVSPVAAGAGVPRATSRGACGTTAVSPQYSRSEVVLTFFERSPLDQVLKNDNVHKIQPSFQSPVKISGKSPGEGVRGGGQRRCGSRRFPEPLPAQHPRVGSGETAPQRMGVVGEGLSLVFMKPPVSTH